MRSILLIVTVLLNTSVFARETSVEPTKVSCSVISRNEELAEIFAYVGPNGNLKFYDIVQNDGTTAKYRVSVSATQGTLTVKIMDNNKKVPVSTWFAAELVAEGSTDLKIGAKLKVATGTVANIENLQNLLQVACEVQ